MRVRNLSLTLWLAVAGLAGCGDDTNNNVNPDAKPPIDSDPGKPAFKKYDANEGGEVRVEYVRNGAGVASPRVTAFLYDNAGTTKFFEYVNLNGCTDSSTKMNWPTAENPVAERTYLDPGKVIIAGGPQLLEVPRSAAMGKDVPGRTHPADKWFFRPPVFANNDGATFIPEKTKFDVIFTGSDNLPGQIFDDVLFMPADFAVISPALSGTPFPIPAGTPQTFTWTTPASNPPTDYEVSSLVAFTGANGPVVLCVEPNDGSITVPKEMIDIARAKYPNGGTLARQTLTHVVRELVDKNGPTGKRIDFLTIWCYATPFSVP